MKLKILTYCLSISWVTQWSCKNPTPKPIEEPQLAVMPAIPRDTRTGLQLDSSDLALHWELLKCGLWKSKYNDIGFLTFASSETGLYDRDYFITQFGFSDPDAPTLKSVIQVATFKSIDGEYFKDKNHVYHDFRMAGGSRFNIMGDADAQTFQALSNGHHYKDKKHIFVERHGLMEMADVTTFKTCAHCRDYAKDKNGFYSRYRRIAPSEIPDSIMARLTKL